MQILHSKYHILSGISLLVGGILVVLFGPTDFVGILFSLLGLTGLFVKYLKQTGRVGHLGYYLSIIGTLLSASIRFIPFFSRLRHTDISTLQGEGVITYLAGIGIFFIIMGVFILGYILLGIAISRAKIGPGMPGILLILSAPMIFFIDPWGRMVFGGALILIGILLAKDYKTKQEAFENLYNLNE